MKFRRLTPVLVMTLISACASAPTSEKSQEPAAPAFSATEIAQSPDNGLMIIGVRAFEMDNQDRVSSTSTLLTGISVKNITTGQNFNIYLTGEFAISPLPPVRYCISNFRTYSNVNLTYDQQPFFDILPRDVANLGYVLLGVNYHGRGGSTRYKPFYFFKGKMLLAQNLTPAARDYVDAFLGKPRPTLSTLAGTTWYGYDFSGIFYEFKLRQDGVVEIRTFLPATDRGVMLGKWTSDGSGLAFTNDKINTIYRGKLVNGALVGTAGDSYKAKPEPDGVLTQSAWVWQATPNPAVALPFNSSPVPRLISCDAVNYPQKAFDAGIGGSVKLHYKLRLPEEWLAGPMPTSKPSIMHITASQPQGVFDSEAREVWESCFLSNAVIDGKPAESEGDETITFEVIDHVPVISYSSGLEMPPASLSPNSTH